MKIKYPERLGLKRPLRDKLYPYVTAAAIAAAIILLYIIEVGG